MFEEQLLELSKLVKNTLYDEQNRHRKFYKNLESIVYEDHIVDEIIEKWNTMIDEPSYHELRELLKKRLNITNNAEIDENIKLESCYWAEKCGCITNNKISLHAVNCYKGQRWYANDLDDYFGNELYKYELVVGGPKHGTVIINGNHDENENEEDIEIKLDDFNRKFECIENLNKFVQDAFDKNNKIKERNIKLTKNFELYTKKVKIKKIIEVYLLFKTKYNLTIGYNSSSKRRYDIFNKKIKELKAEACELLKTNDICDEELKILCQELINILDIVNDDMKDWLSLIDDGVNAYFCKDLSEYICDYI